MTKEEQIEEMAKIMRVAPFLHSGSSEDFLLKRDSAKALYSAGYRKIDDNCEVITKDDLNIYKKQAVKEFAEKLKEICVRKRQFIDIDDKEEYYFDGAVTIDEIDGLLKEYEK